MLLPASCASPRTAFNAAAAATAAQTPTPAAMHPPHLPIQSTPHAHPPSQLASTGPPAPPAPTLVSRSGPMNISYSRSESAPNWPTMSSGLITLPLQREKGVAGRVEPGSPHANVPGAISAWAGAHTAPAPQCQPSPERCSAARADLLLDILCARWVTLTLGSALSTNPPARGSTSEGSSLHGVGGWVGGVEVGVQPGGGAGSKLGKTQGSACCSRQDKSQLQGGHAPPYMHMQINAYACTQTCQAHFCHCPGPNPT